MKCLKTHAKKTGLVQRTKHRFLTKLTVAYNSDISSLGSTKAFPNPATHAPWGLGAESLAQREQQRGVVKPMAQGLTASLTSSLSALGTNGR